MIPSSTFAMSWKRPASNRSSGLAKSRPERMSQCKPLGAFWLAEARHVLSVQQACAGRPCRHERGRTASGLKRCRTKADSVPGHRAATFAPVSRQVHCHAESSGTSLDIGTFAEFIIDLRKRFAQGALLSSASHEVTDLPPRSGTWSGY